MTESLVGARKRSALVKREGPRAALAYRPQDAAAAIGVSRSTVCRMIADGTIEARKLGGATLIRHEELVRVLDEAPLASATRAARARKAAGAC